MTWIKLPALDGRANPCLCCPPILARLEMDRRITVGFGIANLSCDGNVIWEERDQEYDECMSVEEAEALASADAEHDWRIQLYGPLHGEEYQRQGDSEWLLVKKDDGFA